MLIHQSHPVTLELKDVALSGSLGIPENPQGVVVFVHGRCGSRRNARNRVLAQAIRERRMATLLFELLMEHEDSIHDRRFDLDRLTQRLLDVTAWVRNLSELSTLPIGYFGAGVGTAVAFNAATQLGDTVAAIVSRGGRPDLAAEILHKVRAPTLLIVGGKDRVVLKLNRTAFARLSCVKTLNVVDGATHLFDEPGALEEVADLAVKWFVGHVTSSKRRVIPRTSINAQSIQ